ncbi:MAG: hypothetical protein LC793_18545 [Thermomicrobia bacterium]|nr:hypothetical protein [Thermomicrobia bacterium]
MAWKVAYDYCVRCGRTGLSRDEFPNMTHNTSNIYKECERAKCQAWRDAMKQDPVRLAKHRAKERARTRRNRMRV